MLAGASCDHALLVSFAESYLGGVACVRLPPVRAAPESPGIHGHESALSACVGGVA